MPTLERAAGGEPAPAAPPGSLLEAAVPSGPARSGARLTGSSPYAGHHAAVHTSSGSEAAHPEGRPVPLRSQHHGTTWAVLVHSHSGPFDPEALAAGLLSGTRPATGPARPARPSLYSFPLPKPSAAVPLPQGSPHGTASQAATDVSQVPRGETLKRGSLHQLRKRRDRTQS